MTQVAEQLKSRLAELDTKERAEIAYFLIRSLDEDEEDGIDDAWEEEIARRHEEMASGKVRAIPAAEVFESIRARLK